MFCWTHALPSLKAPLVTGSGHDTTQPPALSLFVLSILIALTTLVSHTSFAQTTHEPVYDNDATSRPTLSFGFVSFPPHYYENEKGQVTGLLVKRIKAAFSASGFDLNLRVLPLKRVEHEIKNGHVDAWMDIGQRPSLANHAIYSKLAVSSVTFSIFSLHSLNEIVKLEDLKGKRIIIMRGYSLNGQRSIIENNV